MNRTVSAEKQEWRRRQRALCRGRCPEERAALADSLGLHLGRWLEAVRPTVVLAFRPLDDEPSLPDLPERIRAGGLRAALPRVRPDGSGLDVHEMVAGSRCVAGPFGLSEPDPATCPALDPGEVAAVLVPGLAFDRTTGVRLGRGGGYYDRLLGDPRLRAVAVGVAFPWQLVDGLPVEAHDRRMDFLATPAGLEAVR